MGKKSESQISTLFPKDYWNRPKPEDRGDDTVDPIFHAVGEALTLWENAEWALAMLFLSMSEVETSNASNAVRRAFGFIESSSGRRAALEVAAEIYFGPHWLAAKKSFKELMTAFSQASGRRDDIAHGMAYSVSTDNEPKGAFLFAAEYNTGRTFPYMSGVAGDPLSYTRAKYRYTAATIRSFASKFGELNMKVWGYRERIRKIGGTPGLILDAQHGEGAAQQIEALLAQQPPKTT